MKEPMKKFYAFLDTPIYDSSRVILALLVIPFCMTFTAPLWTIHLKAPQYPKGLHMSIWAYKIEGGNEGQDIKEINLLNHYIGMREIEEDMLPDLDWIPFGIGVLVLLTLRAAAIGNVRSLIDLSVLTLYFAGFSLGRFIFQMYSYGHHLDPRAPITIEPFWPPILGSKKIANFTSTSLPAGGSYYLGIAAGGIALVTVWHLLSGFLRARRAENAARAQAETSD